VSRSGRGARRARLIAAGQWQAAANWTPSRVLGAGQDASFPDTDDQQHRERILAERDEWIMSAGTLGWQRECDRRRAERTTAQRIRRTEGKRP
jgi:hypothetical protein